MAENGFVIMMDRGLSNKDIPNPEYQKLKAEFDRLCDEQEKIDNTGFGEVYKCINEELLGGKPHPTLYPYTDDEEVLRKALEMTGHAKDEAFCKRFMDHYRLFVKGKEVQLKALTLLAEFYPQKEKQVEGWQFVPITIVGSEELVKLAHERMMKDAQEGKGLFGDITIIPQEDEAMDELLGIEPYGLKCSLVPFYDDLMQYGIVDNFLGQDLTRGLFSILKDAANYLKENTDKPLEFENKVAGLMKDLGNLPIWGIFFQILVLQGLCRLLESATIDEGDDGYHEINSLYNWLLGNLGKKEVDFCYKPYGEADLDFLKPLCAYLKDTSIGQLVQTRIFGAELHPEHIVQIPQEKQTTSKKGRPSGTLKEKMIDDEDGSKLEKLHKLIEGKKGRDAALVILACMEKGWMTRPTFTQVKEELGVVGSQQAFNKYLDRHRFTSEELEGMMQNLS